MHPEGAIQAIGKPMEEQARVIVPFLLKAFASGLGGGSRPGEGAYPPTAPWKWSTPNAPLAEAVSKELSRVGVRAELCEVGHSKPSDTKILHEKWAELMVSIR